DSGLGGEQGGLGYSHDVIDRGGWGGIPGDTGLRGPLGAGGLPVHTSAQGYAGMPTGTPNGQANDGGVGRAYESANSAYQNRGFLDRALDFFEPLGIHNMRPVPGRQPTYIGGDYHLGVNPGATLGSLASMAVSGIPGLLLGPPLSRALAGAYTALGG